MEEIEAHEAKTRLPELLEQVARGRRITITKHGVPVAALGPYDPEKHADTEAVVRELVNFRENNSLSGLNLREMIEEDRN